MNILINASNLHVGGGVQVASSFIDELGHLLNNDNYNQYIFTILISTTVKDNLCSIDVIEDRCNVKELNSFGLKCSREIRNEFYGHDVIFNVFGPTYFKTNAKIVISGFAQAWIAYPDNLAYRSLSVISRLKSRLTYNIKEYFFKLNNILVVESPHIKNALIKKGYNESSIKVVSNTISGVFHDINKWKPIGFERDERFTIGFIGRSYSHKNIQRLIEVNKILVDTFKINCVFLFTLDEDEMLSNGFSNVKNFFSTGAISIEQCPSFYNEIDALIFPSLLECFSVSPLESMIMNKLVIASDLPFVRDICGDNARYFTPNDNYSIAEAICLAIKNPRENEILIKNANVAAKSFISAKERAESYLRIILDSVKI